MSGYSCASLGLGAGASLSSSSWLVVVAGGLFAISLSMIACCSVFHWGLDIRIHDQPVSSVPGMMQGRRLRLVLMALRSFLTSALVGWEPTMCWDGLVSKLSRISATVGAMLVH